MRQIQERARVILNALDCPDGELSVLIVDDPQIAELNAQYLDRQGPTNVIAFPMDPDAFPGIEPKLIGDVVISVETATREGEMAGFSMEKRLTQLLIHGILHLFDYDHLKTTQEAREMDEKSTEMERLIWEGGQ
jgi:probable rRNA maturation factor